MQEVTVACACGRKMSIDALRGRGAYRCGCGAAVRVQISARALTGCAVTGCRAEPTTESPVVGLCEEHLAKITLGLMPRFYAEYPPQRWFNVRREYEAEFGALPEQDFPPLWALTDRVFTPELSQNTKHEPIVYFLAIGDKVKIGTTTNKRQRFASMLPPDAKFILELNGSYGLEARLHARFAADRLEGEWFRLSDRIKAFVQSCKERTTTPSVDT